MRKRIFSGAQPTGQLHIGNYLGALKNWVELQDEYESFYCIVNLHAITLPQDPATLRQKTRDLARIYLAAGIDPEKSTVFIQSDVAEHSQLTWVLSCVARMGELERMTQFKDKARKRTGGDAPSEERTRDAILKFLEDAGKRDRAKAAIGDAIKSTKEKLDDQNLMEALGGLFRNKDRERAGVGLFTYPVLMAADILLYQTDLVPIGQDQKQHLELTRDLAERFNRDYGEAFKIPEPYIPKAGAKIGSLQDPAKKMSKSDEDVNGSIFLLDDADTITKKVKRAVTDSGTDIKFDESRPAITNLLTIYHLLTGKSSEECESYFHGKGYGHFKTELAEAVVEFLKPFQERVHQFDDATLDSILESGADKARSIARETLADAYRKMGVE
jgi:tryptophanyl-tRNA synthetase